MANDDRVTIAQLQKMTGLTRKEIAEFLVDWEMANSSGEPGDMEVRKNAIAALLSQQAQKEKEVIASGELMAPGMTAGEVERMVKLALDNDLDFDDIRAWFVRQRERNPNKSYADMEEEFLRGRGARVSMRSLASELGVTAQSISSFIVKWRQKPENFHRSQLDGFRAFADRRGQSEVLQARAKGESGSDKMKIVKALPPGFLRKMSLHGELVDDIGELGLKFRDSGLRPLEAVDHAIHTVVILRAPSIANSIMDAILEGIDDLEKEFGDNPPGKVSTLFGQFFGRRVAKALEEYGFETLLSATALGEFKDEVRKILERVISNDDEGEVFNPTKHLEAAVIRALLDDGTKKSIYFKLPYSLREPIDRKYADSRAKGVRL